ncbi:MAG: hypothetical protein BroJett030_10140 [Alphaproteobacteria bacterium]|nr:MAG: hypothetical protein BroJett030_10140 [Alphaproteobacteria bacterium]
MGLEQATQAQLQPVALDNTMAFMFETRFPRQLTGLERNFDGTPGVK